MNHEEVEWMWNQDCYQLAKLQNGNKTTKNQLLHVVF